MYDRYTYSELYSQKEFLINPMIRIYEDYLERQIDTNNNYVQRY